MIKCGVSFVVSSSDHTFSQTYMLGYLLSLVSFPYFSESFWGRPPLAIIRNSVSICLQTLLNAWAYGAFAPFTSLKVTEENWQAQILLLLCTLLLQFLSLSDNFYRNRRWGAILFSYAPLLCNFCTVLKCDGVRRQLSLSETIFFYQSIFFSSIVRKTSMFLMQNSVFLYQMSEILQLFNSQNV